MNAPTIADIFRASYGDFVTRFGEQSLDSRKAAEAIMACRTEALGGHRYECDHCGHEVIVNNSCRNRHCPQCQAGARLMWVDARVQELLPVGYFHAVFTLPRQLAPFALRNKKTFYALMFRAVKETLLTLSQDSKRLGATVGFVTVLHTWGQTLVDHPHIHCIIPGGGLTRQGRWKPCEKRFLFPIPVLQKMFRGKVLDFFKQAVASGEIQLHGNLAEYADPARMHHLADTLYSIPWVVYVKAPFASPQAVIKYLGQYTHRVAISNYRIVSFENSMVSFRYKDYADANEQKLMTVSAVEFIRRFLLHVIPRGFVRIRHYGFLANRNRPTKLAACCRFFRKKPPRPNRERKRSWADIFRRLKGYDPTRCTQCRQGTMVITDIVLPRRVAMVC